MIIDSSIVKEFLERVKLVQYLDIQIKMQRIDFVNKLNNLVDDGDNGFLLDIFDIFSSSKNEYKGNVGYDTFKIRRKKHFFDMNINTAVAKGNYDQKNEVLQIKTEINGFHGIMIPFYIFVPLFYLVFFVSLLFTDNMEGNLGFAFIPFLIFHALLMMGIPYLMMRRSIKFLKRELERDFYFLTKDDINLG